MSGSHDTPLGLFHSGSGLVSIAFQRGPVAEVPIVEIMRRRLTLTGSTLRSRDVRFKTMVADELAKTVWP